MATLEQRISALSASVGADIKTLLKFRSDFNAGTLTKTVDGMSVVGIGNINDWSAKTATVIQAITTNPTKPSTGIIADYRQSKRIGSNEFKERMLYDASVATAATNGAGHYLFELSNGRQFNSAEHPFYTSTDNGLTARILRAAIPDAWAFCKSDDYYAECLVVPFDATRYRLYALTGNAQLNFVRNDYYGLRLYTNTTYSALFDFYAV